MGIQHASPSFMEYLVDLANTEQSAPLSIKSHKHLDLVQNNFLSLSEIGLKNCKQRCQRLEVDFNLLNCSYSYKYLVFVFKQRDYQNKSLYQMEKVLEQKMQLQSELEFQKNDLIDQKMQLIERLQQLEEQHMRLS